MNYEKWEAGKKAGINFASCYHFDDDTEGSICGAMAVWYMRMPGMIPDMPVCAKHKSFYKNFDEDDILAMIMDFITDIDESKKDENDA
jgi:hypothetical protein